MSGSSIGKNFTVTTWGESHGAALGVVIDGCPANLALSCEDVQTDLDKRKPGTSAFATTRKEDDRVQILSGVFEGRTTGTPISLVIYNTDQKSKDYSDIKNKYRPGHADFGFDQKFGFRDYRGGGRSSGRETAARVAAGSVAKKILRELGIDLYAYASSIGEVSVSDSNFDRNQIWLNPFSMPDSEAAKQAAEYLNRLMNEGNSAGGTITCVIKSMKPGFGEPVFDKLDAALGKAIFSIGSVKGVEIGLGFGVANATGLTNNDSFSSKDNIIYKSTNNAGGITGGMSDGADIIIKAAIKPTPSISIEQDTVTDKAEKVKIKVNGRHDPVIVPRAVIVVEAMAAITLVDSIFSGLMSKLDTIKAAYAAL